MRRDVLAYLYCGLFCLIASTPQVIGADLDKASVARVDQNFGKIPLHFERNEGQTDPQVKYLAHGKGYTAFLTESEVVPALNRRNTACE